MASCLKISNPCTKGYICFKFLQLTDCYGFESYNHSGNKGNSICLVFSMEGLA